MTCPRCKRSGLDPDDFPRDASKANGRKSACRSCDNEKCRRYYSENRERVIARVKARQAELAR